jgi:hypothetical protein
LFGIDNITNNNGWAIAVVGASIVFLGLIILSLAISQIHKILKLWEERDQFLNRFKKEYLAGDEEEIEDLIYEEHHLPSVEELARSYKPLVEQLKEPFKLSQLFDISKKKDFPHPHLSIQRLQEADILVAQGDGTFTWDKQKGN